MIYLTFLRITSLKRVAVKRGKCVWCNAREMELGASPKKGHFGNVLGEISGNKTGRTGAPLEVDDPPKRPIRPGRPFVRFGCNMCDIPLCRDDGCWEAWHA